MTTQAYFLVAHGSRSPQPQRSLEYLATLMGAILTDCTADQVGVGWLEFHPNSLATQLVHFQASLPSSCQLIHVLPVFLLPGNHVREDIPDEVQRAQRQIAQITPNIELRLTQHLGSHPNIQHILFNKMTQAVKPELSMQQPWPMSIPPPEAWILLGHGSRRTAGNHAIAQLANRLKASPAFWAVEPGLTKQVNALLEQGIRSIGVIPYFLFSGKIIAAIADQVNAIAQQNPNLSIELLSPLEPSPQLAKALFDLTHTTKLDEAQKTCISLA